MIEISHQQLYELYLDTLGRCSSDVLSGSDEQLEYDLWEEFDTGATSFLHADSLQRLEAAGFLDAESVGQSIEVRDRWFDLQKRKWTTSQVRTDPKWRKLFVLCDQLLTRLAGRDRSRQQQ